MKFIILLALVAVVASEAPLLPRDDLLIQRTEVRDEAGQISLSYATKDGTQVSEQGVLKPNAAKDGYVLAKTGSYRYFTPDGVNHLVKYVADDQGFQVDSDDVPKSVVAPAVTF